MRIIARSTLREYWQKYPWYRTAFKSMVWWCFSWKLAKSIRD